MSLNLDSLLDTDKLTPAQERAVRRLVHWKIQRRYEQYLDDTIDDGYLLLSFSANAGEGEKFWNIKEKELSNLKQIMYKPMMYFLIGLHSYKIDNPKTVAEIETILNEGTIIKRPTPYCIKFKNEEIPVYFGSYTQVKSQTLFRVLQLVMGNNE